MYSNKSVGAIIVGAGRSSRMGFDKLLYTINGEEVLRKAVRAFDEHSYIDFLVVVAGENIADVKALFGKHPTQKPLQIVEGGSTRAHSVAAGLAFCKQAEMIAIHDGARPFVSAELISRTVEAAECDGSAAPAVAVHDTIKQAQDGFVLRTLPRDSLMAVQTPQVFDREKYAKALAEIPEEDYVVLTDDCMVFEKASLPVRMVQGEQTNRKVTTPEDLRTSASKGGKAVLRVGHGYDVHCLVEGRKLILGGVDVPYHKGLQGHSDADVLLHAVSDALLGGAALGDIGKHFPDTDAANKDANSLHLLKKVGETVKKAGYTVQNIDATLLCQEPKLASHIPYMRKNIAANLGLAVDVVSVKATTEEGLGFTGSSEGIAAHCIVLLQSDALAPTKKT